MDSGLSNRTQQSFYNELSLKAAPQNRNKSSPILKEIICKVYNYFSNRSWRRNLLHCYRQLCLNFLKKEVKRFTSAGYVVLCYLTMAKILIYGKIIVTEKPGLKCALISIRCVMSINRHNPALLGETGRLAFRR
jgi:hypothetical protein